MMAIFCLLVGACVGSFLGVVVSRGGKNYLKNGKFGNGFLDGRSKCDHCQRKLDWWENIPLLSFLILKGRCRTCHSKIPLWYWLIEVSTAGVFLLTEMWWQRNYPAKGVPFLQVIIILPILFLTSSLLVTVTFFDFRYRLIPDQLIILLLSVAMGYRLANSPFELQGILIDSFKGIGLGAGVLFFLHTITNGRAMGWGDVKFAVFMGIFLGWQKTSLALYFAFLVGGLLSAGLLLLGKVNLKQKIAFGPFLVAGTLVTFWYGDLLVPLILRWIGT